MSGRERKTESLVIGGSSGSDGLYSSDGGSIQVSGNGTNGQDTRGGTRSSSPEGEGAFGKTAWFAPIEDRLEMMDCPGGVCPVPWATVDGRPDLQEDKVNHPSHYTDGGIECIDAIEAQLSDEEFDGYLRGNCVKYLWRWKNKGGVEDLKKCRWYLDRLIQFAENT